MGKRGMTPQSKYGDCGKMRGNYTYLSNKAIGALTPKALYITSYPTLRITPLHTTANELRVTH